MQLLLLPQFVRKKVVTANIGLFLHTPFPSSEIFRTLSARSDILRAMLCADHIGFHLFEYARHFLTCCNRMLGIKYEGTKGGTLRLKYFGRSIMVTCSYAVTQTGYINETLALLEAPVVLPKPAVVGDNQGESSADSKTKTNGNGNAKGGGEGVEGVTKEGGDDGDNQEAVDAVADVATPSDASKRSVSPKMIANAAKFEHDAGPSLAHGKKKKKKNNKLKKYVPLLSTPCLCAFASIKEIGLCMYVRMYVCMYVCTTCLRRDRSFGLRYLPARWQLEMPLGERETTLFVVCLLPACTIAA
jgi:hypothetical protein